MFVGRTATAVQSGRNVSGVPVRIASLAEFESVYGGVGEHPVPRTGSMHEAVRLFVANGGGPCWVISTGSTAAAFRAGDVLAILPTLAKCEEPDLVVVPESAWAGSEVYGLQQALLELCAARPDRLLLTEPLAFLERDRAFDWRAGVKEFRARHAALPVRLRRAGAAYVPVLEVAGGRTVSPCPAVAGMMASLDRTQGVWKSPAGIALAGVKAPAVAIDARQQETLNVDAATGLSVNAIRSFPGRGSLVYGARTLAGNDAEWRYVAVRRFVGWLEASITEGLARWVVFEPNNENLWIRVRRAVEDFVAALWRRGALQGTKPDEAFHVRCGLGSTMTEQDVLTGRAIVEIGVACVRPAEFVIVRIHLRTSGA